jgi:hypothetical protein
MRTLIGLASAVTTERRKTIQAEMSCFAVIVF